MHILLKTIVAAPFFAGLMIFNVEVAVASDCPSQSKCGADTCNLSTYDTQKALGCPGYYDIDDAYTTRVPSNECVDCDGDVEGADGRSRGKCVSRWADFNTDYYYKQGWCPPEGQLTPGGPGVGGFGSSGWRKVGQKTDCYKKSQVGKAGDVCASSDPQ